MLTNFKDVEMFCFVAPDGSPQVATIAPEYAMCFAFAVLLASKGIAEHPIKLMEQGFEILPVRVTIEQMGTAEEAFDMAKQKLSS